MSDFVRETPRNVTRWRHPAIKACPDCGHKTPTLQRYIYIKQAWIIRCDQCFCRSVTKMTPKEAVIAWNTGNLSYISKRFIRIRKEKERRRLIDGECERG